MASYDTPKVINLGGQYTQHEAVAGGAIVPGMLLARQSDAVDTVEAHAVAGGGCNPHFAREYYEIGKGIDDAYASADTVIFYTFLPGAWVYALVAANEPAIAKGAWLTSAGDGTLEVAGDGDFVIAQAKEAVDNSASATRGRIRVEVVTGFVLNPATA